jgi:mRNA interferase MazF
MNRGEIWWATLDDAKGREIEGARPCAILSPDDMIGALKTVVVAPLSIRGRPAAFRPAVTFEGVDGVLLLDHIQSIDTTRLMRPAGKLGDKTLDRALAALRAMFMD